MAAICPGGDELKLNMIITDVKWLRGHQQPPTNSTLTSVQDGKYHIIPIK